jgi:undecaprenyl-diphosphatase
MVQKQEKDSQMSRQRGVSISSRKIWVIISAILICSFVLLSKYEDRPMLRNFDLAVTVKVQEKIDSSAHLRTATLVANLMEAGAYFGGPELTSIAVLGFTAWAFLRRKGAKRLATLAIPLLFLSIVAVELLGKSVVSHPPPPFFLLKNPTTVFPKYHVESSFSYPSGHAARAMFVGLVGIILGYRLTGIGKRLWESRLLVAAAVMYVCLVSMGKLYLGHHWFSDIAGGILLGGLTGSLAGLLVW